MTRSHPPTLLTLVRRAQREDALFESGMRVLVAVSGGRDSMALLHALALLRARFEITLVAHGIDHGLRAGARRELERAKAFATELDVPFGISRVNVASGGNLHDRARRARQKALERARAREGADRIALAHHADDRAETVVMRLLRSASIAALGVLPPADGTLVRPLIRARRASIDAHVARHGIPYTDDPSNDDARFLRARVRNELLPFLIHLNPKIVEGLNAMADDALELRRAAPAEARTVAQPVARVTRDALASLVRSKEPGPRVALPGHLVARFAPEHGVVVVEPDRRARRAKQR